MSNCDVITLSSDDENNSLIQDKSPLKQVTEKPESSNMPESRQTAEDDTRHTNKACKRVHPVRVGGELEIEKENKVKFFIQNLKLLPNNGVEHGNETLFEKFLKLCWRNNESPEMEKILHKAYSYYLKAKPAYISSQEFQDLVTCKMDAVIKGPSSIYVYIKDVVDEIKVRRVNQHGPPCKIQKIPNDIFVSSNNLNMTEPNISSHAKQEDECTAQRDDISTLVNSAEARYVRRKIKKLSKALKQIRNRIARLEEKEVDFNEDNNSAFIRLERYKVRFCKVYQKLCELTGDSVGYKATCRRRIAFSGTKSLEINRCIEKFVNKTGQFPDFHDILSLVKTVQSDVNVKPENLRCVAEDAFLSVGKQLQKQRQYESWDAVSVFLKDEVDPAESDPDLESKLQNNYKEYFPRIQNVIDSFAEKQVAEKLKEEEVPDDDTNKTEESESNEDEEEEERDYVEKVLRGEENLSLDEDTESDNHEENGKSGEDGYVLPNQEADMLEQTNNYIHSHDRVVHTQNYSTPLSVDVYRTRELGPVSPPVLGEDLSKRGLCYLQLPSSKEDANTEEKASSLSDTKCKSSSSLFNQHDLLVSESPSPPLPIIPHSGQYKNSVSKSSTLSGITDCDGVPHHSGQQDTPNPDSALCTAIQDHGHLQFSYSQVHEKLKSDLSSTSIIGSDVDSSSPHSKQCDRPKSQASLPTCSNEDDAETFDEDRKSPSLLQLNTADLDSIAENSDSSETVSKKKSNININRNKSNCKHNSDAYVHTTVTGNALISSKYVVTEMEVKSNSDSRISDGEVKPLMRKFVRKVSTPFHKEKQASMKSVPPVVITLE